MDMFGRGKRDLKILEHPDPKMRKQTRERNLRKVFLKILKPRCLGNWNCLVSPKPTNLYYRPGDTSYTELAKGCPFILDCMLAAGISSPWIALKGWLTPTELKELKKYQ